MSCAFVVIEEVFGMNVWSALFYNCGFQFRSSFPGSRQVRKADSSGFVVGDIVEVKGGGGESSVK